MWDVVLKHIVKRKCWNGFLFLCFGAVAMGISMTTCHFRSMTKYEYLNGTVRYRNKKAMEKVKNTIKHPELMLI